MKTPIALPASFKRLAAVFQDHGFSIYLIGGTSRDLLLGGFCRDFDVATDATPNEESEFLPDLDLTFSRFGTTKLKFMGDDFDIATFRRESGYDDFRHPKKIEFIRNMSVDSLRRDFTINAIYIDSNGEAFDFHGGLEDLDNKLIRFIGDPVQRIMEDPLRILRAERFARTLHFEIEEKSKKAIDENRWLLDKLNPEKVKMEKRKG